MGGEVVVVVVGKQSSRLDGDDVERSEDGWFIG